MTNSAWYFDESNFNSYLSTLTRNSSRRETRGFPPREQPDEASIDEWIRKVAKPKGEGWTAKDFESHVREEYSTYGWIIEGMLTRAGFEIVEVNYNEATYAEYLCVKAA